MNRIVKYFLARHLAKAIPKEAEKMFGKNWKTSMGGVGMVLAGIAAIIHCFTCTDCGSQIECITAGIGGLVGGVGLLFAKDHNVTGGDTAQTEIAKATEAPIVAMPPSSVK